MLIIISQTVEAMRGLVLRVSTLASRRWTLMLLIDYQQHTPLKLFGHGTVPAILREPRVSRA